MTFIKDKEITKAKLIAAVGEIIKEHGYTGLGVNKIAKQAGVDKRLIYRYFINLEGLLEAYIMKKDYWLKTDDNYERFTQRPDEELKDFMSRLMVEQFDYYFNNIEVQGLIHWEISEKNELLTSISRTRESKASDLLSRIDKKIKKSNIDFRSLSAIVIAGISYINLHRRFNDCTFCEIDINKPGDRNKLRNTIAELIRSSIR